MSPTAIAIAFAMHGLAIAAVWWISPFRPPDPPQDAIVITVDAGAPPTSPDSPAEDKPAEQLREEPRQALAEPEPRQPEQPQPQAAQHEPPQPKTSPPEPLAQQPPSPSPPTVEEAPAVPEAIPPPAANDIPTLRLPLPPWPTPRPTQATPPSPPRPPQPATAPPPQSSTASVQAPTSNSADWLIGKSRARNAYLDQVARLTARFRRYPANAFDNKQEGRVVTRVTIARDGQLIDVRIDTSSGWPAIDAAELETIRRSAPFPPVPNDMPGDPLILILPIHYDLPIAARAR